MTTSAGQPDSQTAIFVREIVAWYRPDRRPFPWRVSTDTYYVTVCEVLLQKTNAEKVAVVAQRLFTMFPSPKALADGEPGLVEDVLRPLGLRKRASQVREIARAFAGNNHQNDRLDPESLMRLPGVGRYTSAAVGVIALGRPEALIDEHVLRIFRRVFDLVAPPRRHPTKSTREFARTLVPVGKAREYNLGLIDMGRLACRPSRPRCWECPVATACSHEDRRCRNHAQTG